MQKILVTTDFSANSKAGLRFAIQLALQHKYDLTFFHCYYVMKPTSWTDAKINAYEKQETIKIQDQLNRFVHSVYKSMQVVAKNIKCVIKSSLQTKTTIREYALRNKFSYICISTRGAGKIKKIFGTNTSSLINHSDVPVIAVPSPWRPNRVTHILYASDLTELSKELKQVLEFSTRIKAKVEVLHFNSPSEIITDSNILAAAIREFSKYNVALHVEEPNPIQTFIGNLETAIQKSKPSLMIMFTQQNRTFFEKLFQSSRSANYTFNAKIPLLVFKKTGNK